MSYQTLPYRQSLALLTDLYELTMASGYLSSGVADRESVFCLSFRKNPFDGGFAVACGLEFVIDYLRNFKFDESDLQYLKGLKAGNGDSIFDKKFLNYLEGFRFTCDVDAIPEGTVVFPHEPLVRVQGPIIEAQIIESIILNIINFQTLVATKAARVCWAARGDSVLEFGLRRAQGIDGSIAASRAAYIGGCHATSNVFAGKLFGIPVKGTHAHSWVMSFASEKEAFRAYAEAMPHNCIFLVDTYDSLEGVHRAVQIGKLLREKGGELEGIRLDSGDLAYLSKEARRILDGAGFQGAKIVASNELDENTIASIKNEGGKVNVWGVGTKLVTAHDGPHLTGVYKLSAIHNRDGEWEYKIKLSEDLGKITIPGVLQVRRFWQNGECVGDLIYDMGHVPAGRCTIVDPTDITRRKVLDPGLEHQDLLVPIFRKGECVYEIPSVHEIRQKTIQGLDQFHPGIKRFVNPHRYPAGMEQSLHDVRTELILKTKRVQ